MSRTYRRRGERHEYRWVPRDRSDAMPWWARLGRRLDELEPATAMLLRRLITEMYGE